MTPVVRTVIWWIGLTILAFVNSLIGNLVVTILDSILYGLLMGMAGFCFFPIKRLY